jgi:hypothetical protein
VTAVIGSAVVMEIVVQATSRSDGRFTPRALPLITPGPLWVPVVDEPTRRRTATMYAFPGRSER